MTHSLYSPSIPFRLLCLSQRVALLFLGLGALLFVAGQLTSIGSASSLGAAACAGGLAIYATLAAMQLLLERRLFFVGCPICGARSGSAAWTTSFQCDCPRCSRVYAAGIFVLRFFSPKRAVGRTSGPSNGHSGGHTGGHTHGQDPT